MDVYEQHWAQLRERLRAALATMDDGDARGFAADFAEHVQELYAQRHPDDGLAARLSDTARQVARGTTPAANLREIMLPALQTSQVLQAELDAARAAYEGEGSEESLWTYMALGGAYFALMAALGACMSTGLDAAITASERAATARGQTISAVQLDEDERAYVINDYLVSEEYEWQVGHVERRR